MQKTQRWALATTGWPKAQKRKLGNTLFKSRDSTALKSNYIIRSLASVFQI